MQVTLRPHGIVPRIQGAFLCALLGVWTQGAWLALGLCASALEAILGPGRLADALRPATWSAVSRAEAPLVLTIVVPFLVLWTLGGGLMLAQALLLLFGRETVRWGPGALEVERHGLVRLASLRLDPATVSGFTILRGHLLARRLGRTVALARLGTDLERSQLAARLETWHRGFGRRAGFGPDHSPCAGHEVSRDETGGYALTPPHDQQRLAAGLLALMGSALYTMMGFTMIGQGVWQGVLAFLAMGLPATACAGVAVWLMAVRETWHPRTGSLEIRRRAFGRDWSRTLSPLSLEVHAHSDSDGDLHWTLNAIAPGRRQRLAHALEDPSTPEALAEWLSARTGVGIEFTGRARSERRAA